VQHVGGCKFMYENHAFGDATLAWNAPLVDGHGVLGDLASATAWLREGQRRLRARIATLNDRDLLERRRAPWGEPKETRCPVAVMIQHDLYHAGEINHMLLDVETDVNAALRGRWFCKDGTMIAMMSFWLGPKIWQAGKEKNFLTQAQFLGASYRSPALRGVVAVVSLVALIPYISVQIIGAGYVFRVDLRLRPDPASTQVAISIDSALHYYEREGRTWERAAMIKALDAQVNGMQPNFKGMSSQRFYSDYQHWRSNMTTFVQILQGVAQELNTIAGRLETADLTK